MNPSPWLTSAEACDYMRWSGKHRFRTLYEYLQRHGIATARVGRRLRVLRADLDKAMGAGHRKVS